MRAVTFRFEQATTFQYDHTNHQQKKGYAPPVNFFHNQKSVYFYKGEYNPNAGTATKFYPVGSLLSALKRILVAPLNWGLGHVARCIPIIRALEQMGASVILASDGMALNLLKAEFPHLPALKLPSYRIRYKSANMIRNIAWQLPRISYAIRAEQWATERLVREHGIEGIISDNRYGCFSARAKCILLTHQLRVQVPNAILEWAANRVLRLALAKFDNIWVPDVPGTPNLSGKLSHMQEPPPSRVQFIGPLTRLQQYERSPEYDVAVVLSGPEPQRSILEQRLLEQAMNLPRKFIFIQGRTQSKEHYFVSEHVEVVSYLTSKDLNDVLLASKVVVCRSGYSSIMDLTALGKKALLIPTPGQTEQEYLAQYLAEQQLFVSQHQDAIDLESGLNGLSKTYGFKAGQFPSGAFEETLRAWVG